MSNKQTSNVLNVEFYAKMAFWHPSHPLTSGPDVFLHIRPLFEVKIGLPVGNPNFNTQKEVLVMRVVLTVGDERTELLPLVRLG
jgi:hypothetical protein